MLRIRPLILCLCMLVLPLVAGASPPNTVPFNLKEAKKGIDSKEVEEKLKDCQKIVAYLNSLAQNEPHQKENLSQAADLFQGAIYQLTKLKVDLSAPTEGISISIPEITTSPPYPLKLYMDLLSEYSTIAQQLESANLKTQLLQDELDSLEEEINDLTPQWVSLKQKIPDVSYYLVLAQLINSQAQYLYGLLKLSLTQKRIEQLSQLQTKVETLLKKVFLHLKIEKKDLDTAQASYQKTKALLEKIRDQVRNELTRLNRKMALLEVRKTRVIEKLNAANTPPTKKNVLKIGKTRLEVMQEEAQISRKIISQKERSALLDYTGASFRLQWLKCYVGTCTTQEKVKNIGLWKDRISKLDSYLTSVKAAINRLQTTSEIVNTKLITLEQSSLSREEAQKALLLKKAYRSLLQSITSLLQLYQENLGKGKDMRLKMECTLNLFRKRAGGMERLYTWFTENRKTISKKLNAVLNYPIWTIGQTPFTLASILRFLMVLVVGIILVRLIRHRTYRILTERMALSPGPVNSLTTLVYYVMILLVFLIALSEVGVDMKQVTIIFGALGVGIGFGLQTIANNFVSGIILLTERSIQAEDIVELEDGTLGEVRKISIRSTVIRTYDGLDIIVPNSDLVSGKVTTWTYEDDWRRLKIPFGVAYGSDPQQVEEVAKKAARSVGSTVEDPHHPVQVWFEGLGDSSLNFTLLVWIRMHQIKSKTGLKSDYYFALYQSLNEAGIEIPFSQQDIHIRSIYPEAIESVKRLKETSE